MNARVVAVTNRTFSALRFRNYRLYLASQLISFSGSWMQGLAQAWLVLELTGSGTALGTVTAMQFLPTLFLAPLGGTLADRLDKRTLIIATQSAAGLLAITLGLITWSGHVELWMVYLIAAGSGLITAVDNPARQVFVMEMVGPTELSNAVTLNSVVVNAARAIGPAVGGILIATLGIWQCFVVNGISYVAVVAAMIYVRKSELYPAHRAERAPRQLRQGLRYAWDTPTLRTTLIMLALIGMFLLEFNVTLPLLAHQTFGAGASGVAAMSALIGVGAVFGGLVVAAAGPPSAQRLVGVSALFGALALVLAVTPTLLMAYVVLPFVGAASVAVIAVGNATLQLNSAPHLRGRVMALFSVALMGTTPIGGPLVGWVGEHVDPRASLVVGALAGLGAAAYGWLRLEPAGRRHGTERLVAAPVAGQ
jgi:MFS family permease